MRNFELLGFSEIPIHEGKPEATLALEPNREKIISMWGEMQEQLLDAEISEIFPLPECSVPAKTIFAFSELTQITPEWLSPEYGYGRKVVCKYIISPLLEEQLVVKETKGEAPVYYFAYPDDEPQDLFTGRSTWSPPKPPVEKERDEEKEFKEFLNRVLEDTREVRLSRIHTGTNVRGKEYETIFYFEPKKEEELQLTTILHEEASPIVTQTKDGADFALRGCVFNLSDENLVRAATYRTLQLHSWNGATVTLGGYYENGTLRGILITEHEQDTLPIAKAMAEEEPNFLLEPRLRIDTESLSSKPQRLESDYFTKHNICVEINQPSPKTLFLAVKKNSPEAVQVLTSIPLVLHTQEYLDSIRGKSLLPIKQDLGYQLPLEAKTIEEELKLIHVDPEIDTDLNIVLNRLIEVYGDSLQELILYGSIARGQKRLRSDIDILAIVDNDANTTPERIEGLEKGVFLHEALGSYRGPGITQKMKSIELHTIRHSDFEKPPGPALEDFLNNIKVGAISLWKKEGNYETNSEKNLDGK